METIKKRKVIITKVILDKYVNFLPLEIRLPAHVKKITGVLATATIQEWEEP